MKAHRQSQQASQAVVPQLLLVVVQPLPLLRVEVHQEQVAQEHQVSLDVLLFIVCHLCRSSGNVLLQRWNEEVGLVELQLV